MNESLLQVFDQCQAIATRRPGVICDKGSVSLHICRPASLTWIEVDVGLAVGGIERIQVTEYRPLGFKRHQACCAWEASTLIEQILIS